MTPTIGRIVHYPSHGSPDGKHASEARAAIVTRVHGPRVVDVCVLNPTGLFFNLECAMDDSESPRGGTWRWPPRVAP